MIYIFLTMKEMLYAAKENLTTNFIGMDTICYIID